MSDSRVSSVIQEWAYPGQVHPHTQSLNPTTSNHAGSTNQLTHMDMISYSQSQGLVRGGSDDRVAEQMMGLSYLPYTTPCLSNTSSAGSTNHSQSHVNTQQVCVCERDYSYVDNRFKNVFFLTVKIIQHSSTHFVFLASRTSPPSSCQLCGPRSTRGASARTAQSTDCDARGTTSLWGRAGTRPAGGSCWPSRGPSSCRRKTRSCRWG